MGTGTTWANDNLQWKTGLELAQVLAEKQENHTHFYSLADAGTKGAALLAKAGETDAALKLLDDAQRNTSVAEFCAEVCGWIHGELANREHTRRVELNILIGATAALEQDLAARGYSAAACRLHNYCTDLEIELDGDKLTQADNEVIPPSDHDEDDVPFCECAMCRAADEKRQRELQASWDEN